MGLQTPYKTINNYFLTYLLTCYTVLLFEINIIVPKFSPKCSLKLAKIALDILHVFLETKQSFNIVINHLKNKAFKVYTNRFKVFTGKIKIYANVAIQSSQK